ncbi:MAG: hypothetical protein EZS28_048749 [Streblomastix strix]|uniref:Uncharacterized protein n=1 Tax=Streblomastix strix TaxID=222440 RepID=A0A5J4TE29_9EUKA|nr:MAG: hypothetical protein EZS28_048749 [Streblomastix strix]
MAAASAVWKEIQRGLLEEIDPVYDWANASDEIAEDEDGFVRIMDQVYQQVAGNAIAQARRKQSGKMEVD